MLDGVRAKADLQIIVAVDGGGRQVGTVARAADHAVGLYGDDVVVANHLGRQPREVADLLRQAGQVAHVARVRVYKLGAWINKLRVGHPAVSGRPTRACVALAHDKVRERAAQAVHRLDHGLSLTLRLLDEASDIGRTATVARDPVILGRALAEAVLRELAARFHGEHLARPTRPAADRFPFPYPLVILITTIPSFPQVNHALLHRPVCRGAAAAASSE
ncbi:MAG TPA: phosphoenolpyruvate carboxylase [Nitrospinaceae bacterium]|nr:phosphoenolpyruvate carboxylase [Nitrospinaceae bacterium]